MNCKEFDNWVYSYFEGELEGDLKISMDKHLADCERCRREYAALKSLASSLSSIKLPEVPPGFIQRTLPKLHITYNLTQQSKPTWKMFWLIAASILFGGLIVGVFYLGGFAKLQNLGFIDKLMKISPGELGSWQVYLSIFLKVLVQNPYYVMFIAIFISVTSILWIRKKLAYN
ncbi:zf-HC2 domain-containing protein [bacterium]|nr:zf-HC2 domain-containing protein [bacterium]